MCLRRRRHAVCRHFQATEEDELPGVREPRIRDRWQGSHAGRHALVQLHARRAGGAGGGIMAGISVGTRGEQKLLVTSEVAIDFLGLDGPRVLATPQMIRYMEWTCRNSVVPLLDAGNDTVGTHVNVAHLAAAPMGSVVTF